MIGCEEQKRVAEDARLLAALGQNLLGSRFRLAFAHRVVRVVGPEHDEARLHLVGHLAAVLRNHMHGG